MDDKHKHKRSDLSSDASNEYIRKKKRKHECVFISVIDHIQFYASYIWFVCMRTYFVSDEGLLGRIG